MTVISLREKSETIQLTPKEALEEALRTPFEPDEVMILLYNQEENSYEFWQGGGITSESILWHIKKYERCLLD